MSKQVRSNLQALELDLYAMNMFGVKRSEYLTLDMGDLRFDIYPHAGSWIMVVMGGDNGMESKYLDTPAGERPSSSVIHKWIVQKIEENKK